MHCHVSLHLAGHARRSAALIAVVLFSTTFMRVPAIAAESRDRAPASPELSERATTALAAIQQLFDQAEWDGLVTAVDALIASSRVGSYDCAVAHLYRAQAHLARGSRDATAYAAAIPSLEHAVASGFWAPERVLEWKNQLARLYLHERRFDDAGRVMEEWLAATDAPTPEAYVLIVSAALAPAQESTGPIAPARVERALVRANEGLRLGVRPDETLLYLKAACLQNLQRWSEAAEILEFILSRNPGQPTRWEQLHTLYTAAGRDLPAVLTIERARGFGALDSPRADVALGQHFYNLAQYRPALDALEAGLQRGVEQPASSGLFAAHVAYETGDFARAARLLDAAAPLVTDTTQRRACEQLATAIAIAREIKGP